MFLLHYIYAFSRRFYPKRLTLHSSYSFTFYQHLLSLGIEPMILALLAPCSAKHLCNAVLLSISHFHLIVHLHLADTFIQSYLQCIQAIHFLLVCVPWELNPRPFALLTQCPTTEPQVHSVVGLLVGGWSVVRRWFLLVYIGLCDFILSWKVIFFCCKLNICAIYNLVFYVNIVFSLYK